MTIGMEIRKSFALLLLTLGLFSAGPAPADQIRYLPSAQLTLTEIASTLSSAHKSIDLMYYIYDPCALSTGLIDKILFQKAKAGVRVRLLIDAEGYGERTRRDIFAAAMAAYGIEVRYFNRATSHWNVLANNRLHSKLLLVDNKTYITGGRNIADDYFSLGEAINFVDRDVHVTGASATEAAHAFEKVWSSQTVYREGGVSEGELKGFQRSCLRTADNADVQKFIVAGAAAILKTQPTFVCPDVRFVNDDPAFVNASAGEDGSYLSGDRYQLKHTTRAVVEGLQRTTHSLDLENWGYIPAGRIEEQLNRIRARGLPITLFTNKGVGQIDDYSYLQDYHVRRDNKGSQKAYALSLLGSLEDAWRMTPETARFFIHSKVFVIDRRDVIVGSFNIDPRSYHTNVESAVVARDCPAFAAHVSTEMKNQLGTTYRQDLKCQVCQTPAQLNEFLGPVRAWLSREFQ